MAFIRLFELPECDTCYSLEGTVNSLASASESITFGIIDWTVYYQVGPVTALAGLLTTQTLEFTSTGAFSETVTIECIPFIQGTQLAPNIIIWDDSEIDIEIDTLITTQACQTEFCSECFELIDSTCTRALQLIEFSHNTDAFGLKYGNNYGDSAQFSQQVLIPAALTPIDYPYPTEEKFKFGDGIKKPIKTDSEQTVEFITDMLPDYQHDMLRLAFVHENLTINGVDYFKLEGSYTPDIDRSESLASQVALEIQTNPQNKKANYC